MDSALIHHLELGAFLFHEFSHRIGGFVVAGGLARDDNHKVIQGIQEIEIGCKDHLFKDTVGND